MYNLVELEQIGPRMIQVNKNTNYLRTEREKRKVHVEIGKSKFQDFRAVIKETINNLIAPREIEGERFFCATVIVNSPSSVSQRKLVFYEFWYCRWVPLLPPQPPNHIYHQINWKPVALLPANHSTDYTLPCIVFYNTVSNSPFAVDHIFEVWAENIDLLSVSWVFVCSYVEHIFFFKTDQCWRDFALQSCNEY